MARRVLAIFALVLIVCVQLVLSGNLTGRSIPENDTEITDAELGGAIAAAIVGFVALFAAVLIVAYFLRSRCRTNRRRSMKTSYSTSTFTYAKQYDDELTNSSEVPQTNSSQQPIVSIGLEEQRQASKKRNTATRGRPEVYAISGFPTRRVRDSKDDDNAIWSVEPEVYVIDDHRNSRGIDSSEMDPVSRTMTSHNGFYYGYDDCNVGLPDTIGGSLITSGVVGQGDPSGLRRQCTNDDQHQRHRRSTTVCWAPRYLDWMPTELPPDESGRRRRRRPRSRTTSGEVIIDDALQSTVEHPIYARVGRKGQAKTMTPTTTGSTLPSSDENKSTTGLISQRRPDNRTVTVFVGDDNADSEAASVRCGDVERSGQSSVVDVIRRDTPMKPTANSGRRSVARSATGSGSLSAEYCTRFVDEAFGSIVNPIFEAEMFV